MFEICLYACSSAQQGGRGSWRLCYPPALQAAPSLLWPMHHCCLDTRLSLGTSKPLPWENCWNSLSLFNETAELLYFTPFFFFFIFRVTTVSFVGCLFSTLLSSDGSVTWIGCQYIIHSSGSTPCILAICMLVICGHRSKTDKSLVKLIIWQCNKWDC